MTLAAERKERKKIRLTISTKLEQSCTDCPIAKSKSVNQRYIHCGTKCPVGQKLKSLGEELITTESDDELWSKDEDFYLFNNYSFFSKQHLAKKLNKPLDEIRTRYKYLTAQAETKRGNAFNDFRS